MKITLLWRGGVYVVQDNNGKTMESINHSGTDRDISTRKLQNWSALTIVAVIAAGLPPHCKLSSQFSETSCLGTTYNKITWHVSGVVMAGLSTG